MVFRRFTATAVILIVFIAVSSCDPVTQKISPGTTMEMITAAPPSVLTPTVTGVRKEPIATEDVSSNTGFPCIEFVSAKNPGTESLSIMYSTTCISDFEPTPSKLWVWSRATGEAVAVPLPAYAQGPQPSSDWSLILFRRDGGDLHQELLVVNRDGSNEQRLATIPLAEIHKRYPTAYAIDLEYGWFGDTHQVFYKTRPLFELELGALDAFVLIDANTGAAHSMVPQSEVNELFYSPDGSQVAALGPSELRLINASNGRVQSSVSLDWIPMAQNPLQYSPDGKYLSALTGQGVGIVETATGNFQEISLEFLLWGAGDGPPDMPELAWRDPSTLTLLAPPAVQVTEEELDLFTELLDWEFNVYVLNATQATIRSTHAYRGFYPSAVLSPDLNHLGYVRAVRDSEIRELYVSDIANGTQVCYATGNDIRFLNWGPDSNHFMFAMIADDQWQVFLGQIGRDPLPLAIRLEPIIWLDDDHFIGKPVTSDQELRLYTVRGDDILIASAS